MTVAQRYYIVSKKTIKRTRSSLWLGVSFAAMAVSAGVTGQALAQALTFDIDAGPASTALNEFAQQADASVLYSYDLVADFTTNDVNGEYEPDQALKMMTEGTGLSYYRGENGAFAVRVSSERAALDTAPDGLVRVASMQTTTATDASVPQSDGEPVEIWGRVVDENTGTPLRGALVEIESLDRSVSTNDSGQFRFPAVEPGFYDLRVSYLGYRTLTTNIGVGGDETVELNFTMTGGDEGDVIVIYGSRSSRAQALNQQRTAENSSDILSADDLGNFSGTTFAEALRRAPGVAFQRNAQTGEGTNIIVRGLEPDMNTVKLNDLRLPVGDGVGRSPDLGNLLADSVSKIVVHKTLLPEHDSTGTGGLVEIETISPLNRPRRYASFFAEGGGAKDDFNEDYLVSGTLSGKFGDEENFGLSLSAQYLDTAARTIIYNSGLRFGEQMPLDENGMPTIFVLDAISPYEDFPFVEDADGVYPYRLNTAFSHVDSSIFSATAGAEWQIADHTNLRLAIQHSESERTSFSLEDGFSYGGEYGNLPGGEDVNELYLDLSPGNTSLFRNQNYGYDRDAVSVTNTYSFKGTSTFGKLELEYLLGYAKAENENPGNTYIELRMPGSEALPEYFLDAAVDPAKGFIISPFAEYSGAQIPLPLFSQAGWDFINDTSRYTIDTASGYFDATTGVNENKTASFTAHYDFDRDHLKYLEAGLFYEDSEFNNTLQRSQLGGGANVNSLGLEMVPSDLSRIGIDVPGFTVISEAAFQEFVDNIDSYVGANDDLTMTEVPLHPDFNRQFSREETLAAYIQGRIDIGKLEVIGGVRANRTTLEADNLIYPNYIGPILPENGGGVGSDITFQNEFSELVSQEVETTDILPRVLFNYRQTENLIFRGGYFLSIARPQLQQLSNETRISFINFPIPGPEGVKPILEITSGNPNLKPAETHNYDLGVEYYNDTIGVMKVNFFYKEIENLLQTNRRDGPANLENVILPDHPYFQGAPYFDPENPSSVFITGGSPVNSDKKASIWGIETQVEHQFTSLPGVFSGLGVYANYTYTESEREANYAWAYAPDGNTDTYFEDVPFNQQPQHTGTAAVTYNKYDIDATLTYGYQSKALSLFNPRGLSFYNEDTETLDFRFEYYLNTSAAKWRLFFEGNDLLKGVDDPDLQLTQGGYYTRGNYLGGRRFRIGLGATF